jgi:hypothetical protein
LERQDKMCDWKKINILGIAKIEKCVAEFNIWELKISPYAKFKVKIFEDNKNKFTGFSNLMIIDKVGNYDCSVGYGDTIEDALKDTIDQFIKMTSWKRPEEWIEDDFRCSDSFDF